MDTDLNKNQDIQEWGGKRDGAGRKIGSKKKPVISDFITEKEVKKLVEVAKKQALVKPELLKFLLEQIFGRAGQNIQLSGDTENPFITIIKYAKPDTTAIPLPAENLPDPPVGGV